MREAKWDTFSNEISVSRRTKRKAAGMIWKQCGWVAVGGRVKKLVVSCERGTVGSSNLYMWCSCAQRAKEGRMEMGWGGGEEEDKKSDEERR